MLMREDRSKPFRRTRRAEDVKKILHYGFVRWVVHECIGGLVDQRKLCSNVFQWEFLSR